MEKLGDDSGNRLIGETRALLDIRDLYKARTQVEQALSRDQLINDLNQCHVRLGNTRIHCDATKTQFEEAHKKDFPEKSEPDAARRDEIVWDTKEYEEKMGNSVSEECRTAAIAYMDAENAINRLINEIELLNTRLASLPEITLNAEFASADLAAVPRDSLSSAPAPDANEAQIHAINAEIDRVINENFSRASLAQNRTTVRQSMEASPAGTSPRMKRASSLSSSSSAPEPDANSSSSSSLSATSSSSSSSAHQTGARSPRQRH